MIQGQSLYIFQRIITRKLSSFRQVKIMKNFYQISITDNVSQVSCFSDTFRSSVSRYCTFVRAKDSTTTIDSVTHDPTGKICNVRWEDGFQSEFHGVWLRHNCHCEVCRHKTGQKVLDTASITASLYINKVFLEGDHLKVVWSGPEGIHKGSIPTVYLREFNYKRESMLARREQVKCRRSPLKIPSIKYEDITHSKDGLLKWLQQINEEGLSLVQGVPSDEEQVVKMAEMIGPVMTTIYGTTFDVKAVEDPINVAYSNAHIDLHQDLVYYESPPGLQLLHCLQFDECISGGESFFLDVFTIADDFRINYPRLFDILVNVPATFQKVHYSRDYPVHIVNQKPHIRLNHMGEIVAVYWAPQFEGPLAVAAEDIENYYNAYEMFAKSMRDSPFLLKHRLKPSELVVFNNQRMLHGRNHFKSNGGMRHLKGCYVNTDVFKSMTQVMNNTVGDGRLAKRVGNQCWF